MKNLITIVLGLSIMFGCSNYDSEVDSINNSDGSTPGPSGNVFPAVNTIGVSGQWEFIENKVSGKIKQKRQTYKRGIHLIRSTYNDSLDVGVLPEAVLPLTGQLSENETITAVIGNFGYLPIFNEFLVSYKIAYEDEAFGEEIFETYTISDSLASVDFTYFDFATTANLSQPGAYTIEMSTHLDTDMDSENNIYTRIVQSLTFSDVCNIHSLIFEESNSAFKLYTLDDNGTCNYVVFGNYTLDQENNIITLFVNESGGSVTKIGQIYDAALDDNGGFTGAISVEGLCVQLLDGFEEESYASNLTYIPDDNLEQWLVDEGFDNQMDDYMLTSNAQNMAGIAIMADDACYDESGAIICAWEDFMDYDSRFSNRLTNLAAIEAFPSLQILNLTGNDLDSINITKNSQLKYLYLNFNSFYTIDTSGNPNLEEISLDNNKTIPKVDFSQNSSMKILAMPNIALGKMSGYIGPGGYFDLSNLTQLEALMLGNNNLTSVDVSNNNNLWKLQLGGNNIAEIDVSHLVSLTEFSIHQSPITSLDLSSSTQLYKLNINDCDLQGTLDLSMMENLMEFSAGNNPNLTCIKVNQTQLDNINNGATNFEWNYDSSVTISLDCD
ncbi:hypothetical protein PI23P_00875 [Polaribacter irgensii 23-P]|uniref:Uncharacterized protein n=1 Tax=Polaribacter irgensii 23-P TaxID=313594 RepID=A4C2B2_9FLAO|nr:hypothetical protein [Polaribacter irgensii]EAR11713.1 hypothetical protein PI23P_00875 [Polaribacter irgensii 23-P]